MPTLSTQLAFALVALGMVLTPGPNMIYLISRSICQSRAAGMISLGGVALGFIFYTICAAMGITALVMTMPVAYGVLRIAGAAYMLNLAWQAIRPGGRSPFHVKDLPTDTPGRLFTMGFLTNLLNPKAAVLYLSLLPQFIHPEQGSVLIQSLTLCATQITISVSCNAVIILIAGNLANFLGSRPRWIRIQRWFMGLVLAGLAVRMATEARR